MSYVPLNIYSGYSFLSSTLKVKDIFNVCNKFNYNYFGIADLNVMHSYSEIESSTNSSNIHPIYGASFYYLLNNEHRLLLSCYIINQTGYLNLIKIISNYPQGITLSNLKSIGKGLVCVLSTSKSEEFLRLLQNNKLSSISKELQQLSDCFDDFFFGIEIYTQQEIDIANEIRNFAESHSYKCVAFNKHLYIQKTDAIGYEILQAIKNNTKLENKTSTGPYFFMKEEALERLYSSIEIDNSYDIALKCQNFTLDIPRGKLLSYDKVSNKKDYIRNYCINTIRKRKLDLETYLKRVDYELDIIEKMGFLDYFLIVQDYVLYAKKQNIPVGPGRGSSAGSLISYLLDITEVDSLKYDLLFERFLNPKRTSMPDIDIDFADYRVNEVIDYIKNRYGSNHFAHIITYQTLGAKGALRDIGRVFSYDNRDINYIANTIKGNSSFKEAYFNSPMFKSACDDDYFLQIIKLAKKIEGLPRQAGIHAAGIILNDTPINDSLPTIQTENGLITQFDALFLEKLGYLKMDILSLTNLSLIESMVNYIKSKFDDTFTLNKISFNDQKTFSLLNLGLTGSIFQLESSGITKALKEVKVNSFDDIVAILALYRPGPMDNIPLYANNKNKNEKITYIHPILEKILKKTYGVIIYQEQIMQITQLVAGFDLGKADLFRRAISKKDASTLQNLKDDFINGAQKNNINSDIAIEIFNLIYKFANYGFNKSHTVSYAIITYYMAYIKANYPLAFFASILNTSSLNDAKSQSLKKEMNYFNINLSLPTINKSQSNFVIDNNNLIIPLKMIKGLNKEIIEQIIEIQKEKIYSFENFMKKAHEYQINKEAISALVNAGYFDCINPNRQTLRSAIPIYFSYYENIFNEGMLNINEIDDLLPIIKEEPIDKLTDYDLEIKTLGILLSGSLLESYKSSLKKLNILSIKENMANMDNHNIKIAGVINDFRHIQTKKKEDMIILNLQDDSQNIEVVIFPKTLKQYSSIIINNKAIVVEGYFNNRNNEISFIANKITSLEEEV